MPPPPAGVVHLWSARLDCDPAELAVWRERLPADEIRRASSFRTPASQQQFMVSRAMLRHILGTYLHDRPKTLRFALDAHGKPRLVNGGGWEFNLAHSADVVLLAVTRDWPLGVDVERVRPVRNAIGIARRFFTAREAAWLEPRTGAVFDRAFFRLWTRKEAVLKATGEGIHGGLGGIQLLDERGAFRPTVSRRSGQADASRWQLTEWQPAGGFVGALAVPVQAGAVQVNGFQWSLP